jgi:sugar lactone lactonase YvrE
MVACGSDRSNETASIVSNRLTLPSLVSMPARLDVTITAPATFFMGQSIDFVANGSSSSLTYTWNFGDGQTAIGAKVTHIFTTVGSYTTTVTVKDGSGETADATLTVQANSRLELLAGSLTGVKGKTDGTVASALFEDPYGIATDSKGTIYITDSNGLRKITAAGIITTIPMMPTVNGAYAAVAVDSDDNVYVINARALTKINSTGEITVVASGLGVSGSLGNDFRGMTVDNNGNIYITDHFNSVIYKVTQTGAITTFAGSGSDGKADGAGIAAQFQRPSGIVFDRNSGNLYVADTESSTIRKITLAGVVTTFAGTSENIGIADGVGTAAQFTTPESLTVDLQGNVYVADTGLEANSNHGSIGGETIRKITPAGVVTTLVGTPEKPGFQFNTFPELITSPQGIAILPDGRLVISSGQAILTVSGL